MAKQTFTTGQVLTAAQMTSLQQTAMGGGDTTAKTTSYVLVAADAGTVVAMNAAGATTITVNTALFAAGDTVFIQNRGAGVCTITAGTATVSTAGSLALGQHEGGTLYFTATGAAVFYDYVQTGAVSPLTTKGDVWGYSTLDARIPVGANDTVLTADSAQALGVKWAAPAVSGDSWTLLNAGGTALTGASTITVSGISSKNQLFIVFGGASSANTSISFNMRFNADSTAVYSQFGSSISPEASYAPSIFSQVNSTGANSYSLASTGPSASAAISGYVRVSGANTTAVKTILSAVGQNHDGQYNGTFGTRGGIYAGTSTISSVSIISTAGNFDAGTIYVYTSA